MMISNAQKLYDTLVAEYQYAMEEISIISRNHSAQKDFILCDEKAFNFDVLVNVCGDGKKEKSPDSLFVNGDTLYFVEFKEGRHDRSDVRQKIHEGIITLFQYSIARNVLSRAEFLALDIRYAVVKRLQCKPESSHFLVALEKSIDYFDLKNIEGFVISQTAVRWHPPSILKLLHKVSSEKIQKISFINSDKTALELTM
jgi:Holliday junction resolvase